MAKNLVIVESPSKATTIKKFLGSTYEVVASNGHVRDLPKSTLGIDIENDFEPKYITIRGKGDLLAKLRKAVKKADKIYLATDPDREGEAISWHLSKALKLDDKNTSRITFNEITKNAVKKSIKEARDIDMNLVDAQQARRVLDRMVVIRSARFFGQRLREVLVPDVFSRLHCVSLLTVKQRSTILFPRSTGLCRESFAQKRTKSRLSQIFTERQKKKCRSKQNSSLMILSLN